MMKRVRGGKSCLALVAIVLMFPGVSSKAQNPAPATAPTAQAPAKAPEADDDPFKPEPAPVLPPGMTGSNVNDPRYKLKAGLNDAGEAAMGIKHVSLAKKPQAFDIGTTNPDDPKVQETLGQLGMGDRAKKMPKNVQMVIAQLAFSNSDVAFQGNHLFQGNFYGINIFDISNPAKASLLTS